MQQSGTNPLPLKGSYLNVIVSVLLLFPLALFLNSCATERAARDVRGEKTFPSTNHVTLAWDANTEPTLGGYQLYYGQKSGSYTESIDVGTKTSYTLTSLQQGKTYYFAVKAYDSTRTIWSDFSHEVSHTIGGGGMSGL